MFDIEQIKADNPIEKIISERIQLKKTGLEFIGKCPFHADATPSFSVVPSKGFYYCHGCGAHGSDAIDFIMAYDAVDFKEACKILGGEKKPPSAKTRTKREPIVTASVYDGITPVLPVPPVAPLLMAGKQTPQIWNPKREAFTTYTPSMVFEYRNEEGHLTGYVLRIDFDDKKITPTIMWCTWADQEGWCHYSFLEPRPLYGLDKLVLNPDAPVLVVEGEKAADAAHELLPNYSVVTWPGGTKAVSKALWEPLRGRAVLLWPDADEPGIEAMNELALVLHGMDASIKVIDPTGQPKGFDAADALKDGWDKNKVITWAKERVSVYSPPVEAQPEPMPDDAPPMEAYDTETTPEPTIKPAPNWSYFKMLGHKDGTFYYLPVNTGQIVAMNANGHTRNALLSIAPPEYWETNFPSKSGIDWVNATSIMMHECASKGFFNSDETIRGRGAWIDEGRPVLHMGEKVYVDGVAFKPTDVESKYVYAAAPSLEITHAEPLETGEAHKLVDICTRFAWENPLSGTLLAGWLVIAPVCGMMEWRPHIYVTGASGSGKSWITDNLVDVILGKMKIKIALSTTEAGIRHKLKHDALPVLFDESEAEGRQDAIRMQGVLNLARGSSSGAEIAKGTADGKGISYPMRSCFYFSSINVSITQRADDSRISRLVLKEDTRPDKKARFDETSRMVFSTINPHYSAKMLARSLKHLKTLQANYATFKEAVSITVGSNRIANQIGYLLAGAYLCHSTKEIAIAEAVEFVQRHDWGDHTTINAKKDEERLLDRICTHRVRWTVHSGNTDATIGELICTVDNGFTAEGVLYTKDEAALELARLGIKVEDNFCYIANSSDPMRKALADTPWASEWGRPLRDFYDAENTATIYFSPGIKSRATKLPMELFY